MNDWSKLSGMKRLFYVGWFLVFLFLHSASQAQSPESIKHLLLKSKPNTYRVNLLLQLGDLYQLTGNKAPAAMDSALEYAYQAHTLSQSLHYLRGIGNSDLLLAKIYADKDDLKKGKPFAQQEDRYRHTKWPARRCAARQ